MAPAYAGLLKSICAQTPLLENLSSEAQTIVTCQEEIRARTAL